MNLIDLYVEEVGRSLPVKTREDIQRELRSLLQDALEDASLAQGRDPDEEMVVEVLRKFGPPEQVAASYQPPRYLIGPRLFPTFLSVMRIVLLVVTILTAISVVASLSQATTDWPAILATLGEGFANLFSATVGALGWVVLVFAIIQWWSPDLPFEAKEWDPRKLKAEPDPNRVKAPGLIAEIVMTLVFMVVLNFYSQWLGIAAIIDGQWVHVPILTQAFFQYLPWINLVMGATVILKGILLRQGAWTPLTRWISIGIGLASVVLVSWLLTEPNLFRLEAADLLRLGLDRGAAESLERAAPALNLVFRMALGIALVTQVIDLIKGLYRLIAPRFSLPANLPR